MLALRAVVARVVVAKGVEAAAKTVAAVPTCTRYRWCNSCSGREADTGSCSLCLCYIHRTVVWAALAGLCR